MDLVSARTRTVRSNLSPPRTEFDRGERFLFDTGRALIGYESDVTVHSLPYSLCLLGFSDDRYRVSR